MMTNLGIDDCTSVDPTARNADGLVPLLRKLLGDAVTAPDDLDWDRARAAWILNVDQRPAAVVHPHSATEVAATVDVARALGYRVAGQGTGHNAAPLRDLSRTILVKTSRMRGIEIDAERRVARVEAGALWQELTEAAAAHGLAGLIGSSPDVGVVGYTLGGGLSWFGRQYGLACDSILAAEIVTADGAVRRTDVTTDPDLLWALRGGGGNFGIVTALELQLYPVASVQAGALFWPIERGQDVLTAWSMRVNELPEQMTTWARFMRFPPFPEIPEPLRGRAFVIVEACYLGAPEDAAGLLAPWRALRPVMDTVATIPTTALSKVHMDPEHPVPSVGDGMMLAEFPPDAAIELTKIAGAASGSPLLSVEVRHLGGALGRPTDSAVASLRGRFALFAVGITPDPASEAVIGAHCRAVLTALRPWDAGVGYLNFTERSADPSYFFTPTALDRLRRTKQQYDSANIFHGNHPVT